MGAEVLARNGQLTVIRGSEGWGVLDPAPDPEEVTSRYREDEYYQDNDPWFEKERWEHEAGLWDPYYGWQAGLMGANVNDTYARFQVGLDWNIVVDVGTGAGWFVQWWHRNVGPAWGIEPSEIARNILEVARYPDLESLRPRLETVRQIKWSVRFNLVLEHLPDPAGELRRYIEAGADQVLVVVPNEFNPLQRQILKQDPMYRRANMPYGKVPFHKRAWFVDKDHINYFDPSGLRACFREAGLKVTGEYATFPMELFILTGLDYRRNDPLGLRCHLARLRFERVLGGLAFKLYGYLYRRFGWGRELVFVGKPI